MSGENRAETGHPEDLPAVIRIETGFYAGLEWPLGFEPTVIGRGRKADLVIGEATISRTHIRIACEEGRFYLEDLGSTNGTQLNGERVDRAEMQDGDELRMGKLQLRLKLTGDPHA
jgi:pSer/pThr/pTyr-binding forkhead associated (FHA) protein